MKTHTDHTRAAHENQETMIREGRTWYRFACALERVLEEEGQRLWVKPKLHARFGLRQSLSLRAGSFVLTTRLEGGTEEVLHSLIQEERKPFEELRPYVRRSGGLALFTEDGRRIGTLGRPAWSWIRPLIEIHHMPRFFLYEISVHKGALSAHVVISHFREGAEEYLQEHWRARAEAALA